MNNISICLFKVLRSGICWAYLKHNWQFRSRLKQRLNVPGYNLCNVLEVLVRDQERNYPLIVNVANRRTCVRDNVKATWQSNTKDNLATLEPLEKANNSKKCIHSTSLLFQTFFRQIIQAKTTMTTICYWWWKMALLFRLNVLLGIFFQIFN